MHELYDEFIRYFYEENKEKTVSFIIEKLQKCELDVLDLYSQILTPALNDLQCSLEEKRICIWKEHVKTAIARTVVECAYPYILKKRDSLGVASHGIAVVLCPPEEYHDLGARMVADMLTICGYNTVYVGSNTPYNDFYNAIDYIRPDVIAISVSNYYNVIATKRIIEELRKAIDFEVTIMVGGNAFADDPERYKITGADRHAKNLSDIAEIVGCEVVK